jgi:hypothetical protein
LQLTQSPLEFGQPLLRSFDSWLEFRLLDQSLRVAVDHACDTGANFFNLRLLFRWVLTSEYFARGLQSATVLGFETLRILEKALDFPPHGFFQEIRSDLLVVAYPLSPEPVRVGSGTAVVRIVATLAFPGRKANRLAIVGVAAFVARE